MLLALLTACRCVLAGSRAYGELSASGVRMCAADAAAVTAAVTATDTDELPLPAVPSSLREPSARASYILDHFWDAMDFADTLRSHNARFMEQAFSNFIAVFPYAGGQSCREAVGTLMRRAEADSTAYVLLADIAEKYLYETASPFFSEEHYIMFLEHLADSPVLGEYRQEQECASMQEYPPHHKTMTTS